MLLLSQQNRPFVRYSLCLEMEKTMKSPGSRAVEVSKRVGWREPLPARGPIVFLETADCRQAELSARRRRTWFAW